MLSQLYTKLHKIKKNAKKNGCENLFGKVFLVVLE